MKSKVTDIIVIPSIHDPRNTITSLAMFQNAFEINPPMPIVVIYGTCPQEFKALAEGGKPSDNWEAPWTSSHWRELKNRFKQIAESDGIPVLFFDNRTQFQVWEELKNPENLKRIKLPKGIGVKDFIKCVDGIFGATYSYGAQRNKAFIVANNLYSRFVFFFDDDTFLAPHVGNMVERHSRLLEARNVYAVTGGYFGQRAFNATIFRKIDQQQEFMGLLGYEIPDDQSTQDLWGWRICDGVLGGNFCLKEDVYKNICCPSMHRTPTTDDKLIGREIRRVFGKQGHVYKTGWPVVHVHFPDRMNPNQVKPYLLSWAKTKAFWALYDKIDSKDILRKRKGRNNHASMNEAEYVVKDFGKALLALAKVEIEQSPSEIANSIMGAADVIIKDSSSVVNNVFQEMKEYEILKQCWPSIMDITKGMKIWIDGKNRFRPKQVVRRKSVRPR